MADITFVAPNNLSELSQLTGTSVVLVDASGNALAKMSTDTFKEIVKLEQIDGVPTESSTNAVSSGGVKAALDDLETEVGKKQDKLTFDDAPTTGSTNPVKSSGVKAAITAEQQARETADASLQQAISNEIAARETADASLQQAITAEAIDRQTADGQLQQAIDAVRRSFYKAAGAVYNATTGYYELNGLTDITEEQMSEIYAIGIGWHPGMDSYARFSLQRIRTNILPTSKNNASGTGCGVNSNNNYVAVSALGMFDACIQLEVACVGVSGNVGFGIFPKTAINMFQNCRVLRKIIGHIVMIRTDANQTTNMFRGCAELREVNIRRLTQNLSFADSPLLYYTSLSYLVSNSSNTEAITVTVHADVYAKLTRTYEGSVMTKIQQEANETGQDATTLAQSWASLSSVAAGKNISFAEP